MDNKSWQKIKHFANFYVSEPVTYIGSPDWTNHAAHSDIRPSQARAVHANIHAKIQPCHVGVWGMKLN